MEDKNITAHLNVSVPFKIGGLITGNVKFGGMYRVKNRFRDDRVAVAPSVRGNTDNCSILVRLVDWIVRNNRITLPP